MHSLKTYIVEDSPVIRDNLIATLQELTSVEVVGCADDEHTAVDWLSRSSHEARLVIVDIFLKSGSGLGVLQAAAAASGDERKWVVFSNYATDDMRNRCLALGADRVFDKSTEIDALIDYCEQLSTGASTRPGALG